MYDYDKEKAWVFTDEGQRMFLRVRNKVQEMLGVAGAVTAGVLLRSLSGDTWKMMACIDRLVELGELRKITPGYLPYPEGVYVRGEK